MEFTWHTGSTYVHITKTSVSREIKYFLVSLPAAQSKLDRKKIEKKKKHYADYRKR